MKLQIAQHRDGHQLVKSDFTVIDDQVIIGSDFWIGGRHRRGERHHVLTIRDGKIVDMQECESRREAERFARRHS